MFIECAKIKFYLLIPFIFPLFIQIRKIFITNMNLINDNAFFKLYRYYLSYTLSVLCILIIKLRSKIEKRLSSKVLNIDIKRDSTFNWVNPLDKEKRIIEKEKNTKNILYLLTLIFLSLIAKIISIVFKYYYKNIISDIYLSKQSLGIILKIFLLILLSKIILKMRIYKHHIFSLFIIVFNSITLIFLFVLNFKISITYISLLYNILISFFMCFFDIIGKNYITKFCDSPYQIMLKIGIIGSILLLIYDIIVLIIKRNDNTDISGIIIGFKNNLIMPYFVYIIFDIVLCFLSNTGIWLILYHLTPCHFIIYESMSEYIYYFIDCVSGNTEYKPIYISIYGIIYILNIFCFLVYDEIIILNICDLNKYTKDMIQHRETIDRILSLKKKKNELVDLSFSINIEDDDDNDKDKDINIASTSSSLGTFIFSPS